MATTTDRLPRNAPGPYFVDASCIDCDQCRVLAPALFARDDESGLSIVTRQPETPDEITLLEDAMNCCATSSIGRDEA